MAGTQTVTILFCDLVASTARRARLGDDAFDEFTGRYMAALRRAIVDSSGEEVKSAGDGLMVVFRQNAADAVVCAGAMHRHVAELDPHDPPTQPRRPSPRRIITGSAGTEAQQIRRYAFPASCTNARKRHRSRAE